MGSNLMIFDMTGIKMDENCTPNTFLLVKLKAYFSVDQVIFSDMSGQFNQAKEIKRRLRVKKKKPGFFIEAGAADGENLSNTLFLEVKHGWTGLLVEANPTFVNNLFKIKRNAWVLPHCLSKN